MAKKNTTTTVATETKVATETESVVPTAVVSNDDGVPEYKWPEGDLIHILMPIFAGLNPHWATVEALAALYERDKMKLDIFPNNFHAHGRNKLVDKFLASGCKWSLWWDADVVPPHGNVEEFRRMTNSNFPAGFINMNPIQRLLDSGHKVVSGIYFGKGFYGHPQYAEAFGNRLLNETEHYGPRNLVNETAWVGFGFILIHRDVYIDIQMTQPEGSVTDPAVRRAIGYSYRYFNPTGDTIDSSEDVAFCNRARKAGHKVFIDHAVFCSHVGEQAYNYNNTFVRPAPLV